MATKWFVIILFNKFMIEFKDKVFDSFVFNFNDKFYDIIWSRCVTLLTKLSKCWLRHNHVFKII